MKDLGLTMIVSFSKSLHVLDQRLLEFIGVSSLNKKTYIRKEDILSM